MISNNAAARSLNDVIERPLSYYSPIEELSLVLQLGISTTIVINSLSPHLIVSLGNLNILSRYLSHTIHLTFIIQSLDCCMGVPLCKGVA